MPNNEQQMNAVDDRQIAYHEAGHAVAARVLGCHIKVVTLSPPPKADWLGSVYLQPAARALAPDANHEMQIAALEKDAIHSLAGPIAQHFASGLDQYCVKGDGSDLYEAEQYCEVVIAIRNGQYSIERTDDMIFFNWGGEFTAAAKELMKKIINKTWDLVEEHWPAIERVAGALLVRRELDQANIDELISTASGEVSTSGLPEGGKSHAFVQQVETTDKEHSMANEDNMFTSRDFNRAREIIRELSRDGYSDYDQLSIAMDALSIVLANVSKDMDGLLENIALAQGAVSGVAKRWFEHRRHEGS
jgi:hypothetical protein